MITLCDNVTIYERSDAGKFSDACKVDGKFSGAGWQDYILQLAPIDVGDLFILPSQACQATHNKLRHNPQLSRYSLTNLNSTYYCNIKELSTYIKLEGVTVSLT